MYSLDDIQRRLALPANAEQQRALVLGLAVQMLQRQRGGMHVAREIERLTDALDAGQYAFCFDGSARAVGFVAWMRTSLAVSRTLILQGPQAVTNWSPGNQVWILDFVARDGALPYLLARLRDQHLATDGTANYFRFKGKLRIAKQLSRQDRSSFFRCAKLIPASAALTSREDILHSCMARFDKARLLGDFLLALRTNDPRRASALWQSTFRVSEIIATRQYRCYADAAGSAVGLLTWAWLSERTVARIAEHPLHALHTSEWNEGQMLCFCDVVTSEVAHQALERDICSALFPEVAAVLLYYPPADGNPARLVAVDRRRGTAQMRQWLAAATGSAPSI